MTRNIKYRPDHKSAPAPPSPLLPTSPPPLLITSRRLINAAKRTAFKMQDAPSGNELPKLTSPQSDGYYTPEKIQTIAQEIRDGTIADVILDLFTIWICEKQENYEKARVHIRELGLDQGYPTERILNLCMRKLLDDAFDHRPKCVGLARHPSIRTVKRASVARQSILVDIAEDMTNKRFSRAPPQPKRNDESFLIGFPPKATTGSIKEAAPKAVPKEEAMAADDDANTPSPAHSCSFLGPDDEYPPATPDRPAPLNLRARSTGSSTHSVALRSVSTPVSSALDQGFGNVFSVRSASSALSANIGGNGSAISNGGAPNNQYAFADTTPGAQGPSAKPYVYKDDPKKIEALLATGDILRTLKDHVELHDPNASNDYVYDGTQDDAAATEADSVGTSILYDDDDDDTETFLPRVGNGIHQDTENPLHILDFDFPAVPTGVSTAYSIPPKTPTRGSSLITTATTALPPLPLRHFESSTSFASSTTRVGAAPAPVPVPTSTLGDLEAAYRAAASKYLAALLDKARAEATKRGSVDLAGLGLFEGTWRDLREEVVVGVFGRKDVVLGPGDVVLVDEVAKKVKRGVVGGCEGWEWVGELVL
ncbi:hypothetical protein BS50DRAFT_617184 [Corynespora cassiicola Philippines]|uniref:Uncharacterized protein n=1 Tax=Corynespora cassiicola Philippines TaxID=1448308 RepID=A0A2T2P274_CORCC|nr:hypothetical protein BS50DRAFT_617184 [Corynespora cassiicola Philippines]